jgi:L-aspartate semialdehyde sulfurtransferase ferredoxin
MAKVEVNIAAGPEQVGDPWICRLVRNFNVQVTIRKATVDGQYGAALLELDGPIEEIQRATAWLMTTGLRVEALQRAVGA